VRQSSAERAAAAEPIWPANEGANDGLSADVPTAPPVFGSTLSTIGAPPTLPPSLKRQTTVDRAKNCESIWDSYKEAIEECDEGQFTECEGLYDRSSYKSKATGEPGPEVMKTIMKEIRKDLPKNIELSANASMFVRYDDEKPQFMQACLTGVQGTPYESGCFMFDIYMPDTYPQTNCLVTHVTKNASMVSANNGPGGFSPNLHRDTGKVCLSLLGTWNGPGWEAGKSNVYQVLSSILWMILGAEHPYYMEPSYGGWEGTAPQSNHAPEVKVYDEAVYFGTAKWAILEQMKTPPVGFEEVGLRAQCSRPFLTPPTHDPPSSLSRSLARSPLALLSLSRSRSNSLSLHKVVMAHFREKKKVIMNCVQVWHDKGTDGLKTKLAPVIEELAAEFAKLMTVEDAQQELSEAQLEVNFILEKIQYLEAKVKAAGKDAKLNVPKAYRRLKMGPQLLEQAQDRVKAKQEQLAEMEKKAVEKAAAAAAEDDDGSAEDK